ncbi:MAG TPA: galactokinase [Nocardioides sp.]|nr:galactokinase [Nocardioides sp.]
MHVDSVPPGDPREIAAGLAARLADPVGVFAAPGRVNLIGEHTDYNAGLCLPVALPHATYAAVARRDDDVLSVTSIQQDEKFERPLGEIAPDTVSGWAAYVAGVAWALREEGHDLPGMDLVLDGRVPLGSGLSSSAALTCSAALAMCAAAGLEPDRQALVRATMRAEAEAAGAPTGGLDQTASLLAEEGRALLIDFRDHTHRQVGWEPRAAGLELLVVDTRATHSHSDGGYGSRREDCEEAVAQLGLSSLREASAADVERLGEDRLRRRVRHVLTEVARVTGVVAALEQDDWEQVGALFTQSHESMRDDFEISSPELDAVVDTALSVGAFGARMTGGGFGGSAIALVPSDRVREVVDRIGERFAREGWTAPGILPAPASAGAHEVA